MGILRDFYNVASEIILTILQIMFWLMMIGTLLVVIGAAIGLVIKVAIAVAS